MRSAPISECATAEVTRRKTPFSQQTPTSRAGSRHQARTLTSIPARAGWLWIFIAGFPLAARCSEAHEGLPTSAVPLWHIGSLPITNSMLVTWVVAIGLIIFAQVATRRMQEIPDGAQNFWEWMVESLHNFLEGIIGGPLVNKTFWFFAS